MGWSDGPLMYDTYIRKLSIIQLTCLYCASTKTFRTELIDTMFADTKIEIGFQLSDEAIHYSEPNPTWTFDNQLPE
jgi:hypothetical protein